MKDVALGNVADVAPQGVEVGVKVIPVVEHLPMSGANAAAEAPNSVLLPAPDAPTSAMNSPLWIVMVTSRISIRGLPVPWSGTSRPRWLTLIAKP